VSPNNPCRCLAVARPRRAPIRASSLSSRPGSKNSRSNPPQAPGGDEVERAARLVVLAQLQILGLRRAGRLYAPHKRADRDLACVAQRYVLRQRLFSPAGCAMIRCGSPREGSTPINRPTRLILPDATVGIVPGGPHGLAASEVVPRNQNTPRGTPLPSGVARAVPRHDPKGRSSGSPTPSRAVAFSTSATEAPRVWGVGSDLRALAAFRIEHTDPEVESLSRDLPISGRSRRGREEASEVACREGEEGASQAQAAKEDLARQIGWVHYASAPRMPACPQTIDPRVRCVNPAGCANSSAFGICPGLQRERICAPHTPGVPGEPVVREAR
jgi:hypothetical protein